MVKEKKTAGFWMGLIALVVAVVALIIAAGGMTGNVISVAKGEAGVVYTKAEIDSKLASLVAPNSKACNGDSFCEVNGINSSYGNMGLIINPNHILFSGPSSPDSTDISAGMIRLGNKVYLQVSGNGHIITGELGVRGNINMTGLPVSNNSMSFVCIDSIGKLYKKTTACA